MTIARPGGAEKRAWRHDALGVAFVLLGAALVVAPLLRPGISLGPFDLLSRAGLTHRAGVRVHNAIDEDQILQFVPWTTLAWRQVHAGHLPLWDPYNVLGTPLAFNWQSAVFSPPNLLSYLFPLRYAYTVVVVAKLVIAGTGAYAACRVLKLGVPAAAFGGIAFELSGPMVDRYGWAMTGVTIWCGWIFALTWLLVRGRHRLRDGALLAAAVALAVYGGHPESLVVLGVVLVVFVAVCVWAGLPPAGQRWWRTPADLGASVLGGAALSSPLLLPGWQLADGSARSSGTGEGAFSFSHLPNILLSGLQGSNYRDTAYVGVVGLVLAVVGLRFGWARRSVKALVAVALVSFVLTFTPLDSAIESLPFARLVTWNRAVMFLAFSLAILAAFGIEALLGGEDRRKVRNWTAGGFAACGLVVLLLFVVAAAEGHTGIGAHRDSLVGPAADAVAGLALALAIPMASGPRTGRRVSPLVAGVVLLALQTGYLAASGASYWSESSSFFTPTAAVTSLQRAVGASLVGLGQCHPIHYDLPATVGLGISANANIGYGVHEFSVYDVIVPHSYARSWHAASGQVVGTPRFTFYGIFCPDVTTSAQARMFGVRYVLEPGGSPGPDGAVFDTRIGGEDLFEVPGAARATLVALDTSPAQVPPEAQGTAVRASQPSPASWRLAVQSSSESLLRLRLTAVPGWHATMDGRPLKLLEWANRTMLEAVVPPGHHVVKVVYAPVLFTAGVLVASVTAGGFALVMAARGGLRASRAARRRRSSESGDSG